MLYTEKFGLWNCSKFLQIETYIILLSCITHNMHCYKVIISMASAILYNKTGKLYHFFSYIVITASFHMSIY